MEHYIIGSRLFAVLFPENQRIQARVKDTTDYDVLVECEPTEELKRFFKDKYGSKTELHYCPPLWREMKRCTDHNGILRIVPLQNVFFTLKASHVCFDKVHKEKTFFDLYLMSGEGCRIIDSLFFELHQYWTEKFGEKWRADFTRESAEFFDDAVSRENVHDELHKACAKFEQPAFKYLQYPGQTTVWVCPEKWVEVDEEIRQRVVIEEAQTLALERNILPGNLHNKNVAYQRWIKALIDRLAPLWMVPYIINKLNYFLNFKEDYGKTYLLRHQ